MQILKKQIEEESDAVKEQRKGPDLRTLFRRFWKVAAPYWSSDDKFQATLQLAGVFALSLATTGINVGFNFLGRDFFNSLASKLMYINARGYFVYLQFISYMGLYMFCLYMRFAVTIGNKCLSLV